MTTSLCLYVLRINPNRLRKLHTTRKMKGKYDGEFLLLGNGPSCANLTLGQVKNFKDCGGKVGVMNNFLTGNRIPIEMVDFYFLMDPEYWDPKLKSDNSLVRKLAEAVKSDKVTMELVQPVGVPDIIDYHNICYVEGHTVAGLFRWQRPTIPFGFPNSVALRALSFLKYLGFSRIYFAGLDSDMYRYYVIDDLNQLHLDSEYSHFNSNMVSNENGRTILSLEGKEISTIVDMLYSNAIFMRDFKRITKDIGINVGQDKSNDSSPRACLVDLTL